MQRFLRQVTGDVSVVLWYARDCSPESLHHNLAPRPTFATSQGHTGSGFDFGELVYCRFDVLVKPQRVHTRALRAHDTTRLSIVTRIFFKLVRCGWHGATWCHSVAVGPHLNYLGMLDEMSTHACTPAHIRHAAETLLTLAARRAAPGGRQPLPYPVGLIRTPTPPNNGCFGQCGRVGKFSIECSTDDTCMGLLFDGPTSNWHRGRYSVRPYILAPDIPLYPNCLNLRNCHITSACRQTLERAAECQTCACEAQRIQWHHAL